MLRNFRGSRGQSASAGAPPAPGDPRLCRAGCGATANRTCAYVDRRGRPCGTRWCADHVIEHQAATYCRRHIAVVKALSPG